MDLLYTVNRKVIPKPFLNQERYVIIIFSFFSSYYRYSDIKLQITFHSYNILIRINVL